MTDEHLISKEHIDFLLTSLSKFYAIFNKIKHFVPKKHKLTIYNAYVCFKYPMELKIMRLWVKLWNADGHGPGVGVTKAPFVNFSVSTILDLVKLPLRLFEPHLYLTGATATKLRRHLSNKCDIQ